MVILDTPAYFLEVAEPSDPPPMPKPCQCPRTEDGYASWRVPAETLVETVQVAQQLQNKEDTFCLLLDPPRSSMNLTPSDLLRWGKLIEQGVRYSVCHSVKGKRFPCGDKAYCDSHRKSIERREANEFSGAIERDKAFFSRLYQQYPEIDKDRMKCYVMWADTDQPGRSGLPIQQTELAKHFKKKPKTIKRWLDDLERDYPDLYKRLEFKRKDRVRKNGAYQVRD